MFRKRLEKTAGDARERISIPPAVVDIEPKRELSPFTVSDRAMAIAIGCLKLNPRLEVARRALKHSITSEARKRHCEILIKHGNAEDLTTFVNERQMNEFEAKGCEIDSGIQISIARRLEQINKKPLSRHIKNAIVAAGVGLAELQAGSALSCALYMYQHSRVHPNSFSYAAVNGPLFSFFFGFYNNQLPPYLSETCEQTTRLTIIGQIAAWTCGIGYFTFRCYKEWKESKLAKELADSLHN